MAADIQTARLRLHQQTLDEMAADMEAGDELASDFWHTYRYQQAHEMGYPLDWLRLWQFCRLTDGVVVGGACFKGKPDENGRVEIGYGIAPEHQRLGYATEAIAALVCWAKQQCGVRAVTAEIDEGNLASQRVAEHAGLTRQAGLTNWWIVQA